MENLCTQFLHIYFWVFIVLISLKGLCMLTYDFEENKINAIKRGNWNYSLIQAAPYWALFVLSCFY